MSHTTRAQVPRVHTSSCIIAECSLADNNTCSFEPLKTTSCACIFRVRIRRFAQAPSRVAFRSSVETQFHAIRLFHVIQLKAPHLTRRPEHVWISGSANVGRTLLSCSPAERESQSTSLATVDEGESLATTIRNCNAETATQDCSLIANATARMHQTRNFKNLPRKI